MSNFLKSSLIKDGAISALSRMLTLAPTVWRDAAANSQWGLNDTITVRVPAYATAHKRAIRGGGARSRKGLYETAVPISLDWNLQHDTVLTDAHQSLDITNFSLQVMNPKLQAIARGIEDVLISDAMLDPDYEFVVDIDDHASPYHAALRARKHLNDASVPDDDNRYLAVGSSVEAEILGSPQLARVDQSGSDEALRRAIIGRFANFWVVPAPGLPPDEGYAYHRTAYALSTQAPTVPAGAPSGFTVSQDGFAIRVVQILDSDTIENVVAADAFAGATAVTDKGYMGDDGKFVPMEGDPSSTGSGGGGDAEDLFVRGVKLTLDGATSTGTGTGT